MLPKKVFGSITVGSWLSSSSSNCESQKLATIA